MAFLNRKIRAAYAGALGAFGLAVGAALDPLTSRSDDGRVAVAPVSLRAASSPVPAERQIEGKTIEWWRARAVENRRAINRLRLQAAAQASTRPRRSSNSSSNQSNNSSSNQSNNSSSNSSSNQSNNTNSNQSSNS